jgi:lipoprotein-anchoring transpeptidase ErfK/SrfK
MVIMLGKKIWGLLVALTLLVVPFGTSAAHAAPAQASANTVATAQTAAIQPGTKATTTARVNFRTGPGLSYAVIQVIPAGASVSVVSGPVNSVWYKVSYAGRTGYVHGSYLASGGTGGGTGSGKLIIVDLSDQWVYAYEGGKQVFAAPTSTGKDGFRTPTGTFKILSKYRTKTMQGSANGETWRADNVPYVMFFTTRGHALHGAPWLAKSVFGSGVRRSHGCVNLPVDAAGWFYNWAPLGTTVQVRQ